MSTFYFYKTGWYPGCVRAFVRRAGLVGWLASKGVVQRLERPDFYPGESDEFVIDVPASNTAIFESADFAVLESDGRRECYFVTDARYMTPGTLRVTLQLDGFMSAIYNASTYPTVTYHRMHITGAGGSGGGLLSSATEKFPLEVTAWKVMPVETQAGALRNVVCPNPKVDIVVAFSFTAYTPAGGSNRGAVNKMFIVRDMDSYSGGGYDINSAIASLQTMEEWHGPSEADGQDVATGGVCTGVWVLPYDLVPYDTRPGTLQLHDSSVIEAVNEVTPMAAGERTGYAFNLTAPEDTVLYHMRVGNPRSSVQVTPRTYDTPIYYRVSVDPANGTISFGIQIDNQILDLTDSVTMPFSAIPDNADRQQRAISDTLGLVGSGLATIGAIAAVPATGGLSLLGAAGAAISTANQFAQVINRPVSSTTSPNGGVDSLYCVTVTPDGMQTGHFFTGGFCIMYFENLNGPNISMDGYPFDLWVDGYTPDPDNLASSTGCFIKGDAAGVSGVPMKYRAGMREQLASGMVIWNGPSYPG